MQKRTLFSFILISVLLVTGFLLISYTPAEKKEKTTCCKQDMNKCPAENKSNSSGEMIIETLSRQFISVSTFATTP